MIEAVIMGVVGATVVAVLVLVLRGKGGGGASGPG
jgi:hypothetical protein